MDHIHPIKIINDFYQNKDKKGALLKLVHPPSFQDFQTAYRVSDYIRERSPHTKVGFGAVDHNGSWKYSIDPESKFFKSVSLFQERLFGEIGKISNENPHFKKRLLDSLGGSGGVDPRLVGKEIFEQILDPKYSLYHVLSDSERLEIQNIISSEPQSKDFEEMQNIEMNGIFPKYQSSSYGGEDYKEKEEVVAKQKKAIKRYIKCGKKLGINMEFTPIEEFEK